MRDKWSGMTEICPEGDGDHRYSVASVTLQQHSEARGGAEGPGWAPDCGPMPCSQPTLGWFLQCLESPRFYLHRGQER